jgi:hypothetical protein
MGCGASASSHSSAANYQAALHPHKARVRRKQQHRYDNKQDIDAPAISNETINHQSTLANYPYSLNNLSKLPSTNISHSTKNIPFDPLRDDIQAALKQYLQHNNIKGLNLAEINQKLDIATQNFIQQFTSLQPSATSIDSTPSSLRKALSLSNESLQKHQKAPLLRADSVSNDLLPNIGRNPGNSFLSRSNSDSNQALKALLSESATTPTLPSTIATNHASLEAVELPGAVPQPTQNSPELGAELSRKFSISPEIRLSSAAEEVNSSVTKAATATNNNIRPEAINTAVDETKFPAIKPVVERNSKNSQNSSSGNKQENSAELQCRQSDSSHSNSSSSSPEPSSPSLAAGRIISEEDMQAALRSGGFQSITEWKMTRAMSRYKVHDIDLFATNHKLQGNPIMVGQKLFEEEFSANAKPLHSPINPPRPSLTHAKSMYTRRRTASIIKIEANKFNPVRSATNYNPHNNNNMNSCSNNNNNNNNGLQLTPSSFLLNTHSNATSTASTPAVATHLTGLSTPLSISSFNNSSLSPDSSATIIKPPLILRARAASPLSSSDCSHSTPNSANISPDNPSAEKKPKGFGNLALKIAFGPNSNNNNGNSSNNTKNSNNNSNSVGNAGVNSAAASPFFSTNQGELSHLAFKQKLLRSATQSALNTARSTNLAQFSAVPFSTSLHPSNRSNSPPIPLTSPNSGPSSPNFAAPYSVESLRPLNSNRFSAGNPHKLLKAFSHNGGAKNSGSLRFLGKRRALIIDTISVSQRLSSVSLHRCGYSAIDVAVDSETALQHLADNLYYYDLIIIDLQLANSNKSALQIIREIRHAESLYHNNILTNLASYSAQFPAKSSQFPSPAPTHSLILGQTNGSTINSAELQLFCECKVNALIEKGALLTDAVNLLVNSLNFNSTNQPLPRDSLLYCNAKLELHTITIESNGCASANTAMKPAQHQNLFVSTEDHSTSAIPTPKPVLTMPHTNHNAEANQPPAGWNNYNNNNSNTTNSPSGYIHRVNALSSPSSAPMRRSALRTSMSVKTLGTHSSATTMANVNQATAANNNPSGGVNSL